MEGPPKRNFIEEILERLNLEQLRGERSSTTFALEGPVCAGKSTALSFFESRANFLSIKEYTDYSDWSLESTPPFPPKSKEDAMKAFGFFIGIERKRKAELEQEEAGRCRNIVLDRSVFTLLAFEVGAAKTSGINILDLAVDYIVANKDSIIFPHHIIYLDASLETIQERGRQHRANTDTIFFSKEFNEGFREFFVALSIRFPGLVTFVDANAELETVTDDIEEIVEDCLKEESGE